MPTVTIPSVLGIVAVVVVVALSATQTAARRHQLHRERMKAIEKGLQPPEDAGIDSIGPSPSLAAHAALHGTIWTMLGLGLLVSRREVDPTAFHPDVLQLVRFVQLWAWPAFFVGIGLLVFALFARVKPR